MNKSNLTKSLSVVLISFLAFFLLLNFSDKIQNKEKDDKSKSEIKDVASVVPALNGNITASNNENSNGLKNETVDDQFIMRVLENDLTYDNLKKIYLPSEIITQQPGDEYLKTNNGKLLIFKTDTDDQIQFFQNDFSLLANNMVFISNKITLDKDIKIGIDKSLLETKFHTKIPQNKITVQNIEGYISFTFLFKNNKLTKIIYNVEYID